MLSLAVILPLLAACDSVEDRVADHFASAEELTEAGEIDKAILEYRNAIRLQGDHVPSRLGIAFLLEEKGRLAEAVQHFQIAAENDLQNVPSRVRLAQYMLVTRNIDRALEFSEQAYALSPEEPDVLAVRSATAYQLGNKEFALELARTAVGIEPTHAAANVVLITERVESGELDEGLSMTETVLAVHDEDLSLHLLRLRLLELLGREDDALAQLITITEEFPTVISARRALSRRYVELGELDKAEEQLRALVDITDDRTEAQLQVAQFILRTQGVDAGKVELEALIAAAEADDKWPFERALGSLLYSQGDRESARTLLAGVSQREGAAGDSARVMLAQFALREGDIANAETLVDQVLETDKENADALAIRGALELDRDDYAAAIETLRIGLAQQPDDTRMQRLIGRAYLLNGNEALAADQFANATRNSNYDPVVSMEYVQFLLQRERIDGAEAVLSEASRRAPTNRELLTALAEVRLRQEDWVGAETVAAQLRELRDGGVIAEQVLAASLSGQEQYEESATILRALATDEETRDRTISSLVSTLLADDKADEARDFVESVLAENPGNIRARLLQAGIEQSVGNGDLADQLIDRVITDFPESPNAYVFLARKRMSEGKRDEAEQIAINGAENTNAPALRFMLATFYEQRGDFDGAIAEYEKIFEAVPGSMLAANNLASMLSMHRADDPEALERARTIALRLRASDIPEMQDTVGWVFYLNGDYRAALDSLTRALEGLPEHPTVNYHIGMTYKALERFEEARVALEKAQALTNPSFPYDEEVAQALADLPAAQEAAAQ
ncbi:MAG: tetratricopeptide repeat protein [Pseudomonadota bacterium]